jgi:pimeloyl-ACP methyl ester carboxylesterase
MKNVTISTDGIPIYYEAHGGGGRALVFVHGWCCDRGYWENQLDYFAERYQTVLIDLAGHGESGLGREYWTMKLFGKDVVAVVRQLGLKQIVLIGHSMGGQVIVEAALQLPDEVMGLVGVDTYKDIERPLTKDQIEGMIAMLRADFAEAARNYVRTSMFVSTSDAAFVEKIVEDMSSAPPNVGTGAAEHLLSNIIKLREKLQDVTAPIITINSDYNSYNIEAVRARGIEVEVMSGVGHFVMMEDPDQFNRRLENAISRMM